MDRIVNASLGPASRRIVMVEDDHTVEVLPETWEIVTAVGGAATELRAVVFECERNPMEQCLPGFKKIHRLLDGTPFGMRGAE